MSGPLNPATGKPWTAPQLLKAIEHANKIANLQAARRGYCDTWELMIRLIVKRTGLPFEGRPEYHAYAYDVDLENQRMQEAGL